MVIQEYNKMDKDIRQLREKLRKVYSEINEDFHNIMLKMDKTLETLEGKDD
jgi:hypothetical protein